MIITLGTFYFSPSHCGEGSRGAPDEPASFNRTPLLFMNSPQYPA